MANSLDATVTLAPHSAPLDKANGRRRICHEGGIADPEGFEPSRAGLEIRSPIRARRRVQARARNADANNPSTCRFGNRYPRDESKVFEARDAPEALRRHYGVHDGLGDLADRDVMQGIESAIIESSTIRLSSREAQDRVSIRRHVSGPHCEGDPVVGEFDEARELLVIEWGIRAHRSDRRAEAGRGTFHVLPEDIVHLEEPFPSLISGPSDHPVLERIVHVADAVRHHDGTDRPRPHLRGTAPQTSFGPTLGPEKGPDGRARSGPDVTF